MRVRLQSYVIFFLHAEPREESGSHTRLDSSLTLSLSFLFSLTSLLRPPSLSPLLRVPLSQRRPPSVPLPQPAVPLPLFLPHRRRRFPYPSASTPSLSPNRRRRFPSSPTGDATSPAPQPGRPSPGSRRLSRGALTPSSPWPARLGGGTLLAAHGGAPAKPPWSQGSGVLGSDEQWRR
ncbi:hypothetical protein DAI22_01g407350 [Oryza sativa Japonica Group]|nr:hypothetical protein DAI22_01g407350 [Oryza sativa Japonica Group]